jgi:hypothetical protein
LHVVWGEWRGSHSKATISVRHTSHI